MIKLLFLFILLIYGCSEPEANRVNIAGAPSRVNINQSRTTYYNNTLLPIPDESQRNPCIFYNVRDLSNYMCEQIAKIYGDPVTENEFRSFAQKMSPSWSEDGIGTPYEFHLSLYAVEFFSGYSTEDSLSKLETSICLSIRMEIFDLFNSSDKIAHSYPLMIPFNLALFIAYMDEFLLNKENSDMVDIGNRVHLMNLMPDEDPNLFEGLVENIFVAALELYIWNRAVHSYKMFMDSVNMHDYYLVNSVLYDESGNSIIYNHDNSMRSVPFFTRKDMNIAFAELCKPQRIYVYKTIDIYHYQKQDLPPYYEGYSDEGSLSVMDLISSKLSGSSAKYFILPDNFPQCISDTIFRQDSDGNYMYLYKN